MDVVDRPVEFFLIQEPKPTGPSLGQFADQDIPETIVDMFGRHYSFVSVAPRSWNGELDIDNLRPDEFIVLPGLVYRLERPEKKRVRWLSALWN